MPAAALEPHPVASPAPPSGQSKVVLTNVDGDTSLRIAAALQELIEPPADAVTRFETGATWRVDAYFSGTPDVDALAADLAQLLDIAAPVLCVESIPPENWVTISQAALPPVVAGRFTVHGSHDRVRVPRGPNSILIDAGEAFGTAHHATTMGCLIALDRLARRQRPHSVLDLGAGSGVLAIAAQRMLPRAFVLASDIDPIAVDVARQNARRNGAIGIVHVVADGLPPASRPRVRARSPRYDLVVANILAQPLVTLAPRVSAAVACGGSLVLSGLLETQMRQVLGAYLPRGFRLEQRSILAGWAILTLRRIGR